MKRCLASFLALALSAVLAMPLTAAAADCGVLAHEVETLGKRERLDLCERYRGQVLLIVNTASQCGFTPQFAGLERLYARYREQGFVVLGAPSGDFGGQEFKSADRTEQVCRVNYGVSFPMLSKLHAGPKTPHPLFRALAEAAGRYPGWNFHKYLVGRDGQVLADFPSAMDPEAPALEAAVQQALAAPVAFQGAP